MTTKIECRIDTSQQLSMRLISVEGGNEFQLANIVVSRPPRIEMLDPNQLFWAALLVFGPRINGSVVTNLNISEETLQSAGEIWSEQFTAEHDDQTELFAAEVDDLTDNGREIAVTTRSVSMERRETGDSVLQVLPIDQFTGTMATLFDLAVSSNAAVEGERLYGEIGQTLGVLSVAACFANTLQAPTLVLKDDVPRIELSEAQQSTLEALGLLLRFEQ